MNLVLRYNFQLVVSLNVRKASRHERNQQMSSELREIRATPEGGPSSNSFQTYFNGHKS